MNSSKPHNARSVTYTPKYGARDKFDSVSADACPSSDAESVSALIRSRSIDARESPRAPHDAGRSGTSSQPDKAEQNHGNSLASDVIATAKALARMYPVKTAVVSAVLGAVVAKAGASVLGKVTQQHGRDA